MLISMKTPRTGATALSMAILALSHVSAYTANVQDPLQAETDVESDKNAAMLTRHVNKNSAGAPRTSKRVLGEMHKVDPSAVDDEMDEVMESFMTDKREIFERYLGTTSEACTGSSPGVCGCEEVYQSDYRGVIHTTENSHTCRDWTNAMNQKYPNQGLVGNYCRNPNGMAARAWCFVEDPDILWDYCDVPTCSSTADGTDPACVDTETYYAIDADIGMIKDSITSDIERSHFLGGIVRLVAHDFMDHDYNEAPHLGADGCLDWASTSNTGLETIWCDNCPLKKLYQAKYSRISRADFWVIAGNSVIRQTSINNALDLKKTFYWGREDLDECPGSAERLPTTASCQEVEGVFLERMGLTWRDAVALLGAHTLGRGNTDFSGHHGTWVPNDRAAQVFDKKYYEELFRRAWRPRDEGTLHQDWTTGTSTGSPKMMLNTDICLLYDIDSKSQCCTRTNLFKGNGNNRCETNFLSNNECLSYQNGHDRFPAAQAVKKYLGGSGPNNNNAPFYDAFSIAWFKATTNGLDYLKPITNQC